MSGQRDHRVRFTFPYRVTRKHDLVAITDKKFCDRCRDILVQHELHFGNLMALCSVGSNGRISYYRIHIFGLKGWILFNNILDVISLIPERLDALYRDTSARYHFAIMCNISMLLDIPD